MTSHGKTISLTLVLVLSAGAVAVAEIDPALRRYAIYDPYPPTGTISISDGAEYTTSTDVILTLSATDGNGSAGQGSLFRRRRSFRLPLRSMAGDEEESWKGPSGGRSPGGGSPTQSGQVTHMRFSNNGVSFTSPEPYATTKEWELLSGDGLKSVFVKYRDGAGNWSEAFSDTITLDTTPPTFEFVWPIDGQLIGAGP